jgi:hypothetical protein
MSTILLLWLEKWSTELQTAGAVVALALFVFTPLRQLPLWGWRMLKAINDWQRRHIAKWYEKQGWANENGHGFKTCWVFARRSYFADVTLQDGAPQGYFRVHFGLFNGSPLNVWFTFTQCDVAVETYDVVGEYRMIGGGRFKPLGRDRVSPWTAAQEAKGQVDTAEPAVLLAAKQHRPMRLSFSLPVTVTAHVNPQQEVSDRFDILVYVDTDTKP